MQKMRVSLDAGGRLVIPAAYRKALGVRPGDSVVIALDGREVRGFSPAEALRRAQETVRRHVRPGRHLSDELIAERRRDAKRE